MSRFSGADVLDFLGVVVEFDVLAIVVLAVAALVVFVRLVAKAAKWGIREVTA